MARDEEEGRGDGEGDALAVVQARMSSTRLPGKTLREMAGAPMLKLLLDRLAAPECGASVVVATSDEGSDDPVAELCTKEGVPCVRGSLEDVLGRFVRVVERFGPDVVVRLTGDNPLVDARAVNAGLRAFREGAGRGPRHVGVSNHLEDRTDPYGYCVEVVRPEALRELDRSEPMPEEREHVTLGFRRADFGVDSYSILPGDQRRLRWTVDTEEDFRYVARLFEAVGPECTAESAAKWSESNPHPLETRQTTADHDRERDRD